MLGAVILLQKVLKTLIFFLEMVHGQYVFEAELSVDFELADVDVMNFLSMWNKTDKKMRPSSKRPLNNQVW